MKAVSKDAIDRFEIEIPNVRHTPLSYIVEEIREEIRKKGYDPAQFDILENTDIEAYPIGSWNTYDVISEKVIQKLKIVTNDEVYACFTHSPKYY